MSVVKTRFSFSERPKRVRAMSCPGGRSKRVQTVPRPGDYPKRVRAMSCPGGRGLHPVDWVDMGAALNVPPELLKLACAGVVESDGCERRS